MDIDVWGGPLGSWFAAPLSCAAASGALLLLGEATVHAIQVGAAAADVDALAALRRCRQVGDGWGAEARKVTTAVTLLSLIGGLLQVLILVATASGIRTPEGPEGSFQLLGTPERPARPMQEGR